MYEILPLRLLDRVSWRADALAIPKSTTLIEPS